VRIEIGRILHLKFEIRNLKLDASGRTPANPICDFGFEFEMQDSSNFRSLPVLQIRHTHV
jgi:hypothetical protein